MDIIYGIKDNPYHTENEMSSIINPLLKHYFKTKEGFYVSPMRSTYGKSRGESDYVVDFIGCNGFRLFHTFVECKRLSGSLRRSICSVSRLESIRRTWSYLCYINKWSLYLFFLNTLRIDTQKITSIVNV